MPGRVLRVITRLNRGGPLRQLCALVPGLAARGWTGPVVTGAVPADEADGAGDLRAIGAEVQRLRPLGRAVDPVADARALAALVRVVRARRPDVIHTHTAKAGALGRLAGRICRVPVVHTYHGHHLDGGLLRSAAARFVERRLARWTAAAVALSPRQARDLVEVHRILPADRVHVIAPGLDLDGFRRRARREVPPRLRPTVPAGAARFLWCGRFVRVKDPLCLVEAVARTRRPLHVTMLGRGPLRRATRRRIRDLGLEARIACPGSVADVAPWVAACDALVLCSTSEGTPLAVLEAMALGRPAVVSAVGGVPDVVAHERTGLWVPPGDVRALAAALDRLAGDPEAVRRLGTAARAEAEVRYGAARLADDTAGLYEQVLGSVGTAAHASAPAS